MDFIIVFVVLALVVLVVTGPLRSARTQTADDAALAELEAARDAKYREIRDADLDHRTGKLSDGDWRAQDRALRAQAVDILRRIDEVAPVAARRAVNGEGPVEGG